MPAQADPWVLLASEGDPIAYFNIVEVSDLGLEAELWDGPFAVGADVSGRHYDDDDKVLSILRRLQARLSGLIKDDFDNVL